MLAIPTGNLKRLQENLGLQIENAWWSAGTKLVFNQFLHFIALACRYFDMAGMSSDSHRVRLPSFGQAPAAHHLHDRQRECKVVFVYCVVIHRYFGSACVANCLG